MPPGAPGPPDVDAPPPLYPPPPAWSMPFAWTGALLFGASLAYFISCYQFRFGRIGTGEPRLRPILVDTALFTVFAAHHSLFARAGAKALLRRVVHPAVERSLYTWIASLLFIAVCWRWELVPGVVYRIPDSFAWIGYAAQLAGVTITLKASRGLDLLDLAGVRPVLDGRYGPSTREVRLVTTGLYGLVRHPIYFAWALMVFGAPDMTATRFVFATVSTAYLALAIPWEERGLRCQFGEEYETYQRQVRWRMIPGFY